MDNYELNLKRKLEYAMQMVHCYGFFRVPLDWFDVTTVRSEGEKSRNSKETIHGYGTTYEVQNLLNMYKDNVDRILDACSVNLRKDKQGYTFIAKELESKK